MARTELDGLTPEQLDALTPAQWMAIFEAQSNRHLAGKAQRDANQLQWAQLQTQSTQHAETLAHDTEQQALNRESTEGSARYGNSVAQTQLGLAQTVDLRGRKDKALTDIEGLMGTPLEIPEYLKRLRATDREVFLEVMKEVDTDEFYGRVTRAESPAGPSLDRLTGRHQGQGGPGDRSAGLMDYLGVLPNLARGVYASASGNKQEGRDAIQGIRHLGDEEYARTQPGAPGQPISSPARPNGPAPNPLAAILDQGDTDWRSRGEVPSRGPNTYVGPNDGPRGPAEALLQFLTGNDGSPGSSSAGGVRGQLVRNNPGMSPAGIAQILRRDYSQAAFEGGSTPPPGFGRSNIPDAGPPPGIPGFGGPIEPNPRPPSPDQTSAEWMPGNWPGRAEGQARLDAAVSLPERRASPAPNIQFDAPGSAEEVLAEILRGRPQRPGPSGGSGVADRAAQRAMEQGAESQDEVFFPGTVLEIRRPRRASLNPFPPQGTNSAGPLPVPPPPRRRIGKKRS